MQTSVADVCWHFMTEECSGSCKPGREHCAPIAHRPRAKQDPAIRPCSRTRFHYKLRAASGSEGLNDAWAVIFPMAFSFWGCPLSNIYAILFIYSIFYSSLLGVLNPFLNKVEYVKLKGKCSKKINTNMPRPCKTCCLCMPHYVFFHCFITELTAHIKAFN